MNNIRMIVIDLDGTLLDSNKSISSKNIDYLKSLRKDGYIIVIATGRILDSAIYITKGAEFADYIISNTGSIIYDNKLKKIIYKSSIDKDILSKICALYDDNVDYIEMCDAHYYNRYTTKDNSIHIFCQRINNLDDFIKNHDITAVEIKMNDKIEILYDYIVNNFNSLDVYIMQDSYLPDRWIQIINKDTNKYNSIKIISEIEKVNNNEIIAFGDSVNDLDMINNSGISVAMENAVVEVKNAATYITKSHDDNGVVYFLENYLNR